MLGGLGPPKPPVCGIFIPHTPHLGFRPQAPDAFGINPPSQLVEFTPALIVNSFLDTTNISRCYQ